MNCPNMNLSPLPDLHGHPRMVRDPGLLLCVRVSTVRDARHQGMGRERHASTVDSKAAGDRGNSHALADKKLNDLPLTVKTRLPAGWKVAHFQHA